MSRVTTSDARAPQPAAGAEQRRVKERVGRVDHRVRIVYGLLAACLLAYVVLEITNQSSALIDGWGVAAFEVIVSLLCIARALVSHRGRVIALVLGLGLLSWSIGDIALTAESLGGAVPPTPSVADLFYLAFYPITYVALVLLMRRQARTFSITTWLDGGVAGLGAAAVCAAFLFQGVLHAAGGHSAEVATNLAYPIGDLLLLVMIVGGTAVLPSRRKAQWLLLAAGYFVNTVGDTFNLFGSGIGDTHVGSTFNAIAWPTAILLVSASVWLPAAVPKLRSHVRAPGFMLPGVATVAALVILLVGSLRHIDTTALALAAATLVAAGIRSALSLRSLRALTEERHTQAVTDELTTLGNRRALFQLLETLVLQDVIDDSEAPSLAILFVDLNGFKEVNDSFGHAVGDQLLRQLGERLKGSLRDSDVLVRIGGDEFAVVLTDANSDHGTMVAQRIGTTLEEHFILGDVRTRISASIGIAVMPTDATDPHELLHCADVAMYRAKVDRRPFAIYEHVLDGGGNRLNLAHELREAIEQRRLQLHYQPQLDLGTGEVVGVEALVRWAHPKLGDIPPLDFLPLAEEAGLMDQLTELVLDKALAQCAEWRADGRFVAVSVNISTANLVNPGFVELVERLLGTYQVPANALVLEITETAPIVDFERSRRVIEQLRNLGLIVSVDDFGAGFTSLAYLSGLAVGELKLDRSFIRGLATAEEERDVALVRSTIELAHALGMRVVAEGVEDAASLDLLTELDCDLAQGYLISRPKPAGELDLPQAARADTGSTQ